eukprot:CAMPEP_0170480130 /NCGR_PEP_ID=MMETSP0208-20121228/1088_1 /TAXON_ID=197538 /ORGANISM="Strombidium inclinatum, Strain S3" /LENGTH=44 /DNA_ID= /DNA_START= /DNA_END= /DNA_ORIENTATION=
MAPPQPGAQVYPQQVAYAQQPGMAQPGMAPQQVVMQTTHVDSEY